MLLKQLKYLSALAREKHFGRAAQACHISQPAFSETIRSLEQHLGVTIVQRGQRFHGFTPEGERILKWARSIVADCESLHHEIQSENGEKTGTVRIGAIPTTIPLIALFTNVCIERYGHIHYKIYSSSTTEILKQLEDFELDMGITYLDENLSRQFEGIPLFTEDYVFITRNKNPFPNKTTITWQEATSAPLCLLTPDMHARRSMNAVFDREGLDVAPVVETNSIFMLYAQVRCAGLCSIVPRGVLYLHEIRDELIVIPVEPLLQQQVGIILLRERQRSSVMSTVIDQFIGLGLSERLSMLGQVL